MTNNQFFAHTWLSRMWGADGEVRQLIERRDRLVEQGVSEYDSKKIHGGSDSNPTESRNIEYAFLSDLIEKKSGDISLENVKTHQVIEMLSEAKYREILIGRYCNMKSWERIGKDMNYEKSQAHDLGMKALDAVFPYIPKEAINNG